MGTDNELAWLYQNTTNARRQRFGSASDDLSRSDLALAHPYHLIPSNEPTTTWVPPSRSPPHSTGSVTQATNSLHARIATCNDLQTASLHATPRSVVGAFRQRDSVCNVVHCSYSGRSAIPRSVRVLGLGDWLGLYGLWNWECNC